MSTRILIVEDNPANLELMEYLLRANGYLTLRATDGRQGLLTTENARPDMVVSDIHMPVMDGYELARCLKSSTTLQHIPLVAVTALAMVGDGAKILNAGFDGYLAKPIMPEIFVQQLEAYLPADRREKKGAANGHHIDR